MLDNLQLKSFTLGVNMNKIQLTTLVVTTTSAACSDPIIGDWTLTDYGEKCQTSQGTYDYNGQTLSYDIEACVNDFEWTMSVDSELVGTVDKYKATVDQTILYGGQEFGPYSTLLDGSGSAAITKQESDYKIVFDMEAAVTSDDGETTTDIDIEVNCTLADELTCTDVNDEAFVIKFSKQ